MLHLELVSIIIIIILVNDKLFSNIAEMYVPYRVSVTLAGSNSAALIVCFTEEGGT